MKVYVCRRLRVLGKLLEAGIQPISQKPDIKNPQYSVWLFVETDQVRQIVEDYYNSEEFLSNQK